MKRILQASIFLLLVSLIANSQTNSKESPVSEETNQFFLSFLNKTILEIKDIDETDIRIVFNAQVARLVSVFDKNRSREMFGESTDSFLQLLSESKSVFREKSEEELNESEVYFRRGILPPDPSEFSRKYEILRTRNSIAKLMSIWHPFEAYEFLAKTSQIFGDDENRYFFGDPSEIDDQVFHAMPQESMTRATTLAESFIAGGKHLKALSLTKGVYEADQLKGAKLAEKFISKFTEDAKNPEIELSKISEVLSFGKRNWEKYEKKELKIAIFRKDTLVKLANNLGDRIINSDVISEIRKYRIEDYAQNVGYFSPEKAKEIRAKWARAQPIEDCPCSDKEVADDATKAVVEKVKEAAKEAVDAAKLAVDPDAEVDLSAKEKAKILRHESGEKFLKSLSEFGKQEAPKKQRLEFIRNARKVISRVKDKNKKVWLLTELAFNINDPADKKIAQELMTEATKLVNPDPKAFYDFFYSWRVVSGNSSSNPDRAFSQLEDIITRLNKPANGASDIFEFIGDGLLFFGRFPTAISGEMSEGALRQLGNVDETISRLATRDFKRLSSLDDRVEDKRLKVALSLILLNSLHSSFYVREIVENKK